MKFNKILTNFDIEDICADLQIPLVGVLMKDEIKNLKTGCYVMNLQNSDQSGSHWTSFIVSNTCIYYSDSFGLYPVERIYQMFLKSGKQLYINSKQIQDIKSTVCGWFAISFLFFMLNAPYKTGLKKFEKYLKLWDFDNLKNNDKVIIMIMKKLKS